MAENESIALMVRSLVSDAAGEPWMFSPDDARRLARKRFGRIVAAHRGLVTVACMAASLIVVAAVVFAGTPGARPQHPVTSTPAGDGIIAGTFVLEPSTSSCESFSPLPCTARGGPPASAGSEQIPGTVELLASSGGPRLVDFAAPSGRWRLTVKAGSYGVFGISWRLADSAGVVALTPLTCDSSNDEVVVRADATVGGIRLRCTGMPTIAGTLPLLLAPPPPAYVPAVGQARVHRMYGHSVLLASVNGQVRWLVVAQHVRLQLYGPQGGSLIGTSVTVVNPVNGHALFIEGVSDASSPG
jgi:hypothetical protein